jgi:hypothetical protein
MANALIDPELRGKGTIYPKSLIGAPGNDLFNNAHCLYNAGKHGANVSKGVHFFKKGMKCGVHCVW